MKRILFMHQASTIGGGSYCLLNVVKNIDHTLYVPVVALKSDGPLADELRKLNIEVILFPEMSPIPYNRTLWNLNNIMAYHRAETTGNNLKRLLKDIKIDILYLNNMMLYRYLKPAKEVGVKTVIHVREHWPLDEHMKQLEWARTFVKKYADKLIAINRYSASMFPDKESTIVYDWIDMDNRFEKRPLPKIFGEDLSDKNVYLFTGGNQQIKGVREVLQSFISVARPNDRLLIVGVQPKTIVADSMKARLSVLLHKIGIRRIYELETMELISIDSRIKCIPATYKLQHILEQAYCNISFFTIPHANLTMAESIICGTPSICAETDESLEYSCEGRMAVLYKFGSQSDFKKAIINKVEIEHAREVINENKNVIENMFSKEQNVKRMNDVIKKLF